jgi:hypothetical protein
MRPEVTLIQVGNRPRKVDSIDVVVNDRALLEALVRGRTEPETDRVLTDLARQIAAAAAQRKIPQVHVKPLQGPSGAGVSYGLRLASLLRDPAVGGLQVDSGAKTGVQGEYSLSKAEPRRFTVKARLVDADGEEIQAFQAGAPVDGSQPEVLIALGATVPGPPPKPDANAPTPVPSPPGPRTIARADPRSPFGIEIRIDGRPQSLAPGDGRAVLKLPEKTSYTIRLVNDSDFEAAVLLYLDGLTAFHFAEDRRLESAAYLIIRPKSSTELKGWYRNAQAVDAFTVVRGNGPVGAGVPAGAGEGGSITAFFYAAWPRNGTPPADESSRGDAHTEPGLALEQQSAVIERQIGTKRRAVVTVHYSLPEGN